VWTRPLTEALSGEARSKRDRTPSPPTRPCVVTGPIACPPASLTPLPPVSPYPSQLSLEVEPYPPMRGLVGRRFRARETKLLVVRSSRHLFVHVRAHAMRGPERALLRFRGKVGDIIEGCDREIVASVFVCPACLLPSRLAVTSRAALVRRAQPEQHSPDHIQPVVVRPQSRDRVPRRMLEPRGEGRRTEGRGTPLHRARGAIHSRFHAHSSAA